MVAALFVFADLLAQLFKTSLSVREVWVSITGAVKSDTVSPTARHHCDVSSELCCPGAKSRSWAPTLATRFGVIPIDFVIFFLI